MPSESQFKAEDQIIVESKDLSDFGQNDLLPITLPLQPYVNSSSSDDLSSIEKQTAWDGYLEDVLPQKDQPKHLRNLRHLVFIIYRRLFGLVFVTNMAIFVAFIVKGRANSQELALIVVSNLFCAILMRQEYVINTFFVIFCAVPRSWPLSIRTFCAKVYHLGGIHSGCAISGVVWLILFSIQSTREFMRNEGISVGTIVVTYLILVLLIAMVVFAYPSLRTRAHDTFEKVHRFLGWTATALVWCQVVLLTNDHRGVGQSLGHALIHAPPFWMICIITASLILPWLELRKYPVRSVVLSDHALRLYFDYVTPVPGSFTRMSESPLTEWHSFATIAEPNKKGYSVIVSRAGDWTSRQIANPPTHLWVRGIPTCGVMRVVPLFRRVLLVATGSGIGPCAPSIFAESTSIRLLWTAPNVRKTYGDEFVDAILEKEPGAVIYDTRTHGKPDMVKLAHRLFQEFEAEAVCIISNKALTDKVVYGLSSRGVPAYGAIWDS